MLWSPAILLLLAGAAISSPRTSWEDGKQYTYKIRSRTMTALDQQSKKFTGILIEGRLTVQKNDQGTLRAKISQPRYSPVHTHLENGWDSEIPQEHMNLQNLPLSGEPFEIKKNGQVQDLIVAKKVPTWEVNILKSIVSQLQVDAEGEKAENSKYNQLPEGNQPNALFKSMESSVGGKCEVLYDISPMPESMVQNKPELAPLPELRNDGDFISVVKTKNYSNCDQRVDYHSGISGQNNWEPGSNDNGRYLSRSSVTRVVLSGSIKKHTIQSSVTTNKIVHMTGAEDNQQGMVASKMNLTLHRVEDISDQIPSPTDPQSTGNLVYNFNNPFENSSSRRPNKLSQTRKWRMQSNKNSDESNSNSDESGSAAENDDDNYLQPKPKLTEAPKIPLLPLFIGMRGNSIQKSDKIDVVKSAKNIAQQIGNELQRPDNMPEEQTLEKFTILSRVIRTMNAEQIAEVQRELYEDRQSPNQLNQGSQSQNARRNAWVAFRDAVAQAGTGPALVNIKQWIQNKQIKRREAADVVSAVAKSTLVPTREHVKAFFDMATMQETKEESTLRNAAILSFADLLRHANVDKQSSHNRYPVHTFGRFFSKSNEDLHKKYIAYMAEELKKAIDDGDSKKVQLYATALGKTGHPQILSVFEPYLEGKKQVSPFQRLVMVLSLDKLAEVKPKLARSVLYKIYANTADHHEIRTAAVYLLMETQPTASMLQRMAEFTNYDSNKQVNSAVKSTIESLAKLEGGNRDLANAARAAQPLLTAETYGPQYSRAMHMHIKNPLTQNGISIEANYIGSDDSIVPKGVYISTKPTRKGMKQPRNEFGGTISSIEDLMTFVQQKLNKNLRNKNEKAQEKEYSPENLAKLLGIRGDEPEQLEGFAFMNNKYVNDFISFDNHTLEKIPEQLKRLAEEMKDGRGFEETRMNNYEVTISFPTETGLPFYMTLNVPTLMSINGNAKMNTDLDSDKLIPKSATLSAKIRAVYGMEVQKRLGFVTPFENQEYIVGVNRNMQVHLPIRAEVQFDKKDKEVRVKIQPNEEEKENKVFQFTEQPFTAKHDILNLEPISKDKNTYTDKKDRLESSQMDLNDKNGKQLVKLTWERGTNELQQENERSEKKQENDMKALRKLAQSLSSMYYPSARNAEYQKYSVKLNPSSDLNAEMKMSYSSMTTEANNKDGDSESSSPKGRAVKLSKGLTSQERKEKLLKEATKNINSAQAGAVDISLQVNHGSQCSMEITAAIGKSNVDKKSRVFVFASSQADGGKDHHLSIGLESKTPQVESMDYEETLKANTPREYDAEILYGKGRDENDESNETRMKIQGKVEQTEGRKNQIRLSRDAQSCTQKSNQNGNKLSSVCEKVNQRASSANEGDFTITFENETPLKQRLLSALDAIERFAQDGIETEKSRMDREDKNKIRVKFEMSSDDEKVDVTVKTPEGKVKFNKIHLARNSKENNGKVQDIRNKQNQELSMSQDNQCFLDKTKVKTFDNHRYSVQLGKCWHVAMTSYPKNDPDTLGQKREVPEDMQASIMVRDDANGKKEMKIILGEKEIKLSPSESRKPEAKVDGQKVEFSKKQSFQEKKNGEILFEIFELSDDSLKLVSNKYSVKVIYDGSRAQVEAGERYRASVRGLCGNKNGEPENDQQTPKGCLLQKPEEFAAMYAMTEHEKCEGPARQNAEKAKKSPCVEKTIRPGNVISEREAGRESQDAGKHSDDQENRNMKHRTLVTKNDKEICFSVRPVPMCSSKARPTSTKSKSIQLHCVPRTSASEKVAERVEQGANPDLSQKKVSKTETLNIPVSCAA